jgi:L-ascorbate metabolism protein UlaG (beta-lactamase superfamily)
MPIIRNPFKRRAEQPRYYRGPVSDHFDGVRFFHPDGMTPRDLRDLLRWRLSRGGVPWPAWAPSPFRDKPPGRVGGERLRISFIGHASLLVQAGGLNILIDPVWSARASPVRFAGPRRVNEPGIAFADLPTIDAVLVSHAHYDHMDVATLSRLAGKDAPRIITPLGNDAVMRGHDARLAAEAFDWHDRVTLGEHVAVTLVPLRHWSARTLFDRNMTLWAGFVIETPAGRIYHVSDSGYGSGAHFREVRARYGSLRVAILPIGAYEPRWFMREQHMNPEEAVAAFLDCGAERAIAHHFGTFRLTDEAIDAPIKALIAARKEAGIAEDRFRVLMPGEAWEFT